ncbi:MAG: hypothetical protein E6G01_17835 [Actinobacteria bacterium]|nr:MAG: hypothetical protein E6G01_17835 [Actinomycetota bacterium]
MSSRDRAARTAATTAGQGRLAQLIAARGGKAEPEAPFVIEHREALISPPSPSSRTPTRG